jgi:prepilin-type N-terminal cleavage/methylation domain-containing protein
MTTKPHSLHHPNARAFTLIELLVVIAVIGVLALLTTIGARRLTTGSRLAAGTNAVTSALANARAAAIRDSAPTALVFRASWDPTKPYLPQRTEMVTVRSTGEQTLAAPGSPGSAGTSKLRMLPVKDIPTILLPEGIKVAGPNYSQSTSIGGVESYKLWMTQGNMQALANCAETIEGSQQIAVLFGPDGQFLTRPPRASNDNAVLFVDVSQDGVQHTVAAPQGFGSCGVNNGNYGLYFQQDDIRDEPNLTMVPFLSVYDDRAAREQRATAWATEQQIVDELIGPNGYIAQFGDRITFNRFSGLPERKTR